MATLEMIHVGEDGTRSAGTRVLGPVTAGRVPEAQRLDFLPRHFGRRMMAFETQVYTELADLCEGYNGGLWAFFDLSNGGCYMAPSDPSFALVQPSNTFEGTVSGDAAGIIATLYALSRLAFQYEAEAGMRFTERFHQLREYALAHAEAAAILRAID